MAAFDVRQAIIAEAQSQGVDPNLALAVASRESGLNQNAIGAAGEIGIFQLMPATAAQLGVDPRDPLQNIRGGISFLRAMWQQFGSWDLALAAYNWGPAKLSAARAAGKPIPASVDSYVASILGTGTAYNAALAQPSPAQVAAAVDDGSGNYVAVDPAILAAAAGSAADPQTLALVLGVGVLGVIWALS
jgi:soluble lytic murein transglycosylase-like protein